MRPQVDRSPAAILTHRLLAGLAIVHSALAFPAILLSLRYGLPEWFDRAWVTIVITWLFWPVVLVLHRGRSVLRAALPLFISVLLLTPCVPRFAAVAPRIFRGTDRMPTLDRPNLVESENLGGGFRRVALEEFITGGFESIYHGEYLYFGRRKLSYFVSSSLSPSRAFAAYAADLESGEQGIEDGFHVFIFGQRTSRFFALRQSECTMSASLSGSGTR